MYYYYYYYFEDLFFIINIYQDYVIIIVELFNYNIYVKIQLANYKVSSRFNYTFLSKASFFSQGDVIILFISFLTFFIFIEDTIHPPPSSSPQSNGANEIVDLKEK